MTMILTNYIMNTQSLTSGNALSDWLYNKLIAWGVPIQSASYIHLLIMLTALIILLVLVDFLTRKILIGILNKAAKKTKTKFDDYLIQNGLLLHLSKLVPLMLSIQLIPLVLSGFAEWISPIRKLIDVLLIIVWVMVLHAFFRSVRDYLRTKRSFHDKPIDSYLQVANMIMFFTAGVIIFSLFTGTSPWAFLGAMGAASAILMLIFKDTILGFVASIQVSTNDMVRVGDWIEMPKYGADGDVLEINLNTVKVQNWDKTITTIPTYYLITDSFKNWRGMHESGGRRIKRAINIKISSIRYVTDEEIAELEKIQLLAPYIKERQAEIDRYNREHQADLTMPVNGRHMTNVGLFRQYINFYTQQHALIRKDMTTLVRQLSPSEHGLPIELYMFTSDTRWAIYENIMSDIFDHLLSAIKYFRLEVFEAPASDDIRHLNLSALHKAGKTLPTEITETQ